MSDDLRSWTARSSARPAAPTTTATAAPRPVLAPPAIDHSGDYRPWGAGLPQQTMLEIRRRAYQGESGLGEMLPLHYLMRVSYTLSPHGDLISLAFADCLITVRGRHLENLRRDLANGKVGFIEEFDPKRWDEPGDGEPVVTAVELVAPGQAAGRA